MRRWVKELSGKIQQTMKPVNESESMEKEEDSEVKSLAEFLMTHHSEQLHSIVVSPDPKLHYPLYIEYAIHLHSKFKPFFVFHKKFGPWFCSLFQFYRFAEREFSTCSSCFGSANCVLAAFRPGCLLGSCMIFFSFIIFTNFIEFMFLVVIMVNWEFWSGL